MKLKLIQAGLGGHGRNVGNDFVAVSPDFEYAGLIDPDPKALRGFALRHGIPESMQFAGYKEALREADAEAVLITAASPYHYELCKAALESGKHVLVEKPFTLDLGEAAQLVELADRQGCRLMVNQNYRYFGAVNALREAMRNPSLGPVQYIHAHFFFDHEGKPYQRLMENYVLLEMAVHHVDMIRYLLEDDIAIVRGKTWNSTGSGYRGDPNVEALYETSRGIPVFYASSLLAQGTSNPWEGLWKVSFQKGTVSLDDRGEGYGVYVGAAGKGPVKLPTPSVPQREGIHGVLAEFAAAIRERREPAISGRDNLQTLAALLATARSSRDNKEVRVADEFEGRGAQP